MKNACVFNLLVIQSADWEHIFIPLSHGCVNPLPANFHYCAIDRNDKMINSNLTGIREQLCAQRFLVLERIRKLPQGGNRMNKVGNASLQTEKGCGSYTKVKTFA